MERGCVPITLSECASLAFDPTQRESEFWALRSANRASTKDLPIPFAERKATMGNVAEGNIAKGLAGLLADDAEVVDGPDHGDQLWTD